MSDSPIQSVCVAAKSGDGIGGIFDGVSDFGDFGGGDGGSCGGGDGGCGGD